ncbi:MAG: T9SS type A sorting domain-containing protein [Ferruginibacter sp.]
MKRILIFLFLALAICTICHAQIIRPFTPRYFNSSVRGNIVYVSNSIVSATGIGSGTPGTGEVPPAGSSTNNGGTGIDIDVDNTVPTIIPFATSWKYLDNNSRPANWETPAYSDAAWSSGTLTSAAKDFGYGDGDEDVCIKYGSGYGTCPASPACNPTPAGCSNKFITTLFRKQFTIANLSNYSSFTLNVHRDDGAVIYINGTEVGRSNMPGGAVNNTTQATASVDGATEDITLTISTAAFVNGTNTIAVEIHQNVASTPDMSFRLEMLGLNNQGTHNSSTADLSLATCSEVLFAGLYWGAGEGSNTKSTAWITNETTCLLKLPGAASYTTITSTQTDYHNSVLIPSYSHTGYKCFKDITSLVNATNPNGTYTVANVHSPLGIGDAYGGWTIVIVYANPSLLPRNLTVFDGNAAVKSGSGNVDVNISGFLTPPSGPVSCELGAVVYDGDRTSSDAYSFKQNGAGSFYDLTPTAVNPTSKTNDMWNSVIAYKGVVVTTRNPAFQNTLGYDANIINLPNTANAQLSNNQTSAITRFSSPSENYVVQVLTTSISQYNPTFAFDKTATDINGGSLKPGDSLRYQINYTNVGNDSSTNTIILDNIPAGTTYLPGSLKINGVSKTNGSGDDQAEYELVNNRVVFRIGTGANSTTGGLVPMGVTGNVQFDVIVASSCKVLSCVGSIDNSARINYTGKKSLSSLYDSSGVNISGCITKGPISNNVTGTCFTPVDTILVNKCPATTVTLPWRLYAGYTIYSAMPFVPANIFDPYNPISLSHVYWAYFSNGAGCSDTVKISVFIIACPDIDDDNDGIPDYVELNDPVALQDADGDGIANWNDSSYPGFIDNNSDGFNDNFDPSADSDNDGIPNFYDPNFAGYIDTNGDGVNDNMDKDLDGIPNHLDLDSDNDGIPDTVESYGVDTDGDGVIDNYVDTDNDGFSQNVDANNTGVNNSGVGLGNPDLDGDGIPNYLDTDSDNDGIPDLVEVFGADIDNDGKVDGFVDLDSDGLSDPIDGDVGNDGVAENSANALLRTGPDVSPVNGRADSYPYKNLDNDGRPNPYDCDSDGDGLVDVIESGLPDANYDGWIDGTIGADGWSNTVRALPALNLANTDGRGNPNYLDIDADDDGIPDNVESMATLAYLLPLGTDSDNDGLDDAYDSRAGFGGPGVFAYDNDGDTLPDYIDLDTDSDGIPDIIEGNDFNLNGIADDDVSLTFLDTDGDGLDNRFDSLTSVINIKGTSYNMGNGGTNIGDGAPGSRSPVQQTPLNAPDRDWRSVGMVLNVKRLSLTSIQQKNKVQLNWQVITSENVDHFEIERSIDNGGFIKIANVAKTVRLNEPANFIYYDDLKQFSKSVIIYRIKLVSVKNNIKHSNTAFIHPAPEAQQLNIHPNPADAVTSINFNALKAGNVEIALIDNTGKVILSQKRKVNTGANVLQLNGLSNYSGGMYTIHILADGILLKETILILHKK